MDYREFRRKLAADRAFGARFADCRTLEALVAAAAREGYFFTADDVRNDTRLLPEEAALAAGGLNGLIASDVKASTAFSATPHIVNQ